MSTEIPVKGQVVGGVLDPTYDKSYYTLVSCPRLEKEVGLEEHRACENFGGIHVDRETGAHLLHCRYGYR